MQGAKSNKTERSNSQSKVEPQLAPPGAGIPFYVQLFLKFYVAPFVAARTPWERSKERFNRVNGRIFAELEGLSESQLLQKILVPPQQGLEDSSRFWSVAMTLEHLCIVGRKISKGIEDLSRGVIPSERASTATVKPFGSLTATEAVNDFKKFTRDEFSAIVIQDMNSPFKYRHPWFGPMTAKQWYWLLPVHGNIHLKQIREIKKRISG